MIYKLQPTLLLESCRSNFSDFKKMFQLQWDFLVSAQNMHLTCSFILGQLIIELKSDPAALISWQKIRRIFRVETAFASATADGFQILYFFDMTVISFSLRYILIG